MATVALEGVQELLSVPFTGERRDKRTRLLAQSLGAFLSHQPARRDIASAVAALESAPSQHVEGRDGEMNRHALALLSSLLRAFQAGADNHAATSETAGARTVRARVLAALLQGPMTPTEISKQVSSPPSVIARVLRALKEDGAVEIADDVDALDKRARPHRLTDRGRAQLAAAGMIQWPEPEPDLSHEGAAPDISAQRNADAAHTQPRPPAKPPVVALSIRLRRQGLPAPFIQEALLESLQAAVRADDRAQVLAELCLIHRNSADPHEQSLAVGYLQELAALAAHADDPQITARAEYETARVLMAGLTVPEQADPAAALDRAELAAAKAGGHAGAERMAWCHYSRALLALRTNDFAAAAAGARDAAALFTKLGDPSQTVAAEILQGRSLMFAGNAIDGQHRLVAAEQLARQHRLPRPAADASYWLGECSLRHAPARAVESLRRAAECYKELRDPVWQALAENAAASVEFIRQSGTDRVRAAQHDAERSLDALLKAKHPWGSALASRRFGVIARDAGLHDAATEHLMTAWRQYGRLKDPLGQASSMCSLVIAQAAANNLDEAVSSAFRAFSALELLPGGRSHPAADAQALWCIDACTSSLPEGAATASVHAKADLLRTRYAARARTGTRSTRAEIAATPRIYISSE